MADSRYWLYRLRLHDPGKLAGDFREADLATMTRHRDYLKRLTEDGTVILAGRTDAGEQTFGIVVYRADTEERAREIFEGDPAIAEGLMQGEVFPYMLAFLAKNDTALL